MNYQIRNRDLTLTVSDLGAEAVSVVCHGKERLWQNENGAWSGHAPILFPVCGGCSIIRDGVKFPLTSHGFARRQVFSFAGGTEDSLHFVLVPNEATRAMYPCEFRLEVSYRLCGTAVTVAYLVTNTDKAPLYASCGAHDAFALDGDVSEYEVDFEKEEEFLHSCHDTDGRLTGETRSFGHGTVLPLPADYLSESRTLIFGNISSRCVTLRKRGGKALAEIRFDDFPHLLLWRPKDSHMICIEPWYNLPDDARTATLDADRKVGLFTLMPGESRRFVRSIRWDPEA